MKLISMVDYVFEQKETSTIDTDQIDWYYMEVQKIDKIRNYANFLKQPLELWMFIPCDEEGNVLIEPIEQNPIYWSREYQQAKERCLFNGFRVEEHEKESFSIRCENNILNVMWNFSDKRGWFAARGISTIEDLVKYNIKLTQTAIKQIS